MSFKNRGMLLESLINKTILIYKDNEIGLFHKKELPISFSKVENIEGKLKIDNGYIKKKSTTDYYGVYKGIFVAFEAKSTQLDYLPIANIKEHQVEYLKEVTEHGGIGFFIIAFSSHDEYYVLNVNDIDLGQNKITRLEAKNKGISLELIYPGIIDFAFAIEKMK